MKANLDKRKIKFELDWNTLDYYVEEDVYGTTEYPFISQKNPIAKIKGFTNDKEVMEWISVLLNICFETSPLKRGFTGVYDPSTNTSVLNVIDIDDEEYDRGTWGYILRRPMKAKGGFKGIIKLLKKTVGHFTSGTYI